MSEFTLPKESNDDTLRETFLYMTVRNLMIQAAMDAGISDREIAKVIKAQDEMWKKLGGSVAYDE
jgi:hypothetical protein